MYCLTKYEIIQNYTPQYIKGSEVYVCMYVCLSECDYCHSAEDNKFPELLYEIVLLPTLRIHCLCKKQTNFWDTIVGLTFYLQAKYAIIMKINDYTENKQLTKQPNQRIKQINNYTTAILLLA